MEKSNSDGLAKAVSRSRSLIYAATVIGIVSAILFSINYLVNFDSGVHYFKSNALTSFSYIFLAVGISVVAIACAFIPKVENLIDGFSDRGSYASIAAVVGTVLCTAASVLRLINSNVKFKPLCIAGIAISVLAIAYYVCVLLGKNKKLTVIFGFFAVLQPLTAIVGTYFDEKVEMNSPEKVSIEIAFATVMLFLTVELRFLLGRQMQRFTIAITTAAFISCLYAFIPNIIAHISGGLNNTVYLIYDFSGFCFTVFIGRRLIDLLSSVKLPENQPSDGGNV